MRGDACLQMNCVGQACDALISLLLTALMGQLSHIVYHTPLHKGNASTS